MYVLVINILVAECIGDLPRHHDPVQLVLHRRRHQPQLLQRDLHQLGNLLNGVNVADILNIKYVTNVASILNVKDVTNIASILNVKDVTNVASITNVKCIINDCISHTKKFEKIIRCLTKFPP